MRPPADLVSLPAEFLRSPTHFVSLPVNWYQEGKREQLVPLGFDWVDRTGW